jgi:hypothetical protein
MPDDGPPVQRLAERTEHERLLRVEEQHVVALRGLGDGAHLAHDGRQREEPAKAQRFLADARHARLARHAHVYAERREPFAKRSVREQQHGTARGDGLGERQQREFGAAQLPALIDEEHRGLRLETGQQRAEW